MFSVRVPAACLALILSGACQTLPAPEAPAARALRTEQIAMLRDLGFQETEDGWMLDMASRILFPTDRRVLNPGQGDRLARISRSLCSVDIRAARVEGHADNTGSADYNRALSLDRAEAVATALAAGGMPAPLLRAVGHGDRQPVESNRTRAGRSENRRVAIIVPASSDEQGPCRQH